MCASRVILKDSAEKIKKSEFIRGVYKFKFYVDTGIMQISIVTGRIPEIWGSIALIEWFGYRLSPAQAVIWGFMATLILFMLGYFIKNLGLFDAEMYVDANKNPVASELLEGARTNIEILKILKKMERRLDEIER